MIFLRLYINKVFFLGEIIKVDYYLFKKVFQVLRLDINDKLILINGYNIESVSIVFGIDSFFFI